MRCFARTPDPGVAPGRARRIVGLTLLAGLTAASGAGAQPGSAAPDFVDLALGWARGDYRSPLVCVFDGVPRRGLRRVLIAPGPQRRGARYDVLRFFDLAADDAESCSTALAAEAPNVRGELRFSLTAPSRPDTAQRDFKVWLRRKKGVTFDVTQGALRLASVGGGRDAKRAVSFAGGHLRLERIAPGSDAAHLLADFGRRRRLRLRLDAPDGTVLTLLLVEMKPR